MSFIVSYNGQFKPFALPDLSHYDQIHHVYKSNATNRIKDTDQMTDLPHENIKTMQINAYFEQDKNFYQQRKIVRAKDLMSSPVHCLHVFDTLETIIQTMEKYSYRHIPILDEKEILVGIISDRNLLPHLNKEPKKVLARDIMANEVLTALEQTRIQDLTKIMLHKKIHSLPIINDRYQLTGIITASDILNLVVRDLSHL